MKLDPRSLIAPLLAALVLGVVVSQTVGALRATGTWVRDERASTTPREDPYARLDALLARRTAPPAPADVRDPFVLGGVTAPPVTRPTLRKPPRPGPPPIPVLTSIVWDADPRATVRWDGRDYSIRSGGLFAEFRVVSIIRDQVVLDRNGERIVLALPKKGD